MTRYIKHWKILTVVRLILGIPAGAFHFLTSRFSLSFAVAITSVGFIAWAILYFGESVYGALAAVILGLPLTLFLPRESRLRASLWAFAVLLGFIVATANLCSIAIISHSSTKLWDPGSLGLFPVGETVFDEASYHFGVGVTALATFFSTNAGRVDAPLIVWSTETWPQDWQDELDVSTLIPTLITCGPRDWLDLENTERVPFLIDAAGDSGAALETKIRLVSDVEQERLFTWTTYMNDPSGLKSTPDWSDDALGCVCRGEGVKSYTISGTEVGELVIESAPAAVIPGARQSFWTESMPKVGPIGTISLKTLDSESPYLLDYTFDSSGSLFTAEALENVDIWRELTTDSTAQIVLRRKMTTERGAFLVLGNGGELRVDNEVIRTFDGPFFAIVEPWGAYRSRFQISCAVVSSVIPSGNLSCDCPLMWLYGTDGRYEGAKITITDANGVLRIGNTDYPFEEYDSVALTLEEVAFYGRRTTPDEYVISGDACDIALNGELLLKHSHWSSIPTMVQNLIFAIFSVVLATAFSTLLPAVRRTPKESKKSDVHNG